MSDVETPTVNSEEKALICELKAGDFARFSLLTDRYGKLVTFYFYTRCRCPMDIAMDLTQDAFIRVFRSIHTFDQTRAFKPWLMTICRNVATDYLKSEIARTKTARDWSPPDAPTAEQQVLKTAIIQEAIEKLPERQAEVITLHYLSGLSCAEISQTLKINEGTVKCHLHNARQALMKVLKERSE